MTTSTHTRTTDASVLGWTALIGAIWLLAAVARSDTTLHLGPLLLPIVPAVFSRGTEHPLRITAVGIVGAAAIVTVLSASGNLDGPSLGVFPNALNESIIFLGIGSIIAIAIATSGRTRSKE